MSLILFGIRKTGRQYYGKLIAKRLKYSYQDTDELIERQYFKEEGIKLKYRDIYLELGDEQFRLLERKAIMGLNFMQEAVITIGNATLLHPMNISHLSKLGPFVFLKFSGFRSQSSEIPFSLQHSHISGLSIGPNQLKIPSFLKVPVFIIDITTKKEDEIFQEIEKLLEDFKKKPLE